MRKRARERDGEVGELGDGGRFEGGREEKKECSVTDSSGHINFFSDLQKGVRISEHYTLTQLSSGAVCVYGISRSLCVVCTRRSFVVCACG